MHTTPETPNPDLLAVREQLELERLRYKLTMIRVQTKALETLERLMDDQEVTGNEKADKAKATERNRQRLAANQTLIHCRTAERERRLACTSRARQEAASSSPRTSGANPSSQPSPARGEGASPPSPLAGEGGRASGRMRGRSESSNDQGSASWGAMVGAEGAGHADSSAQHRPPHGLRPISDRTQTMPPKLAASKKFIKPKHPRRSRKRKRAQG